MEKEPTNRYGSATALAEDLQRRLADEPVKAYREPLLQHGLRWLRKHRTLAGSSMAASLAYGGLPGGDAAVGEAHDQEHIAKVQKEEQLVAATEAAEAVAGPRHRPGRQKNNRTR